MSRIEGEPQPRTPETWDEDDMVAFIKNRLLVDYVGDPEAAEVVIRRALRYIWIANPGDIDVEDLYLPDLDADEPNYSMVTLTQENTETKVAIPGFIGGKYDEYIEELRAQGITPIVSNPSCDQRTLSVQITDDVQEIDMFYYPSRETYSNFVYRKSWRRGEKANETYLSSVYKNQPKRKDFHSQQTPDKLDGWQKWFGHAHLVFPDIQNYRRTRVLWRGKDDTSDLVATIQHTQLPKTYEEAYSVLEETNISATQ